MKIRQIIPDWIKGVSITLMVYGHITFIGSSVSIQKQFAELIYTFHMPLFLIISGFFFNMSMQQGHTSVKKIIHQLIFPYLFFISLYCIGLILIQKVGIFTNNLPPKSFIDFIQIIFIHPRGSFWFLHSLILIQLSFIVAKSLVSKAQLDDAAWLIVSFFFLAMLCNFGLIISRTISFFLLGMTISRFNIGLPAALRTSIILLVTILIFAKKEMYDFSFTQVAWCLCVLTCLVSLGSMFKSSPIILTFAWLGRNSLVILVFHAFFVVLFKPLVNLFLVIDQTGLVYSITVVFIATLCSIMFGFLLDKIQISKYLFGVNTIYSNRNA